MSHWLSLSSSQTIFCEDEEDECCFSWLLKDLVLLILQELSLSDAVACFRTCRLFWQLSHNAQLWERVYRNTYGVCFVRTQFVALFEHQMEIPAQSVWTVGETSRCVTRPLSPFPLLPWRWMAMASTVKAGTPRVRLLDAEDETADDDDALAEQELHYAPEDLNIKTGLAYLETENQQTFKGLWRDGDIVLGIYRSMRDEDEQFVFGGELLNRRGNGLGVTVFPSGGHYVGDFVNGELDGEGALYYKEGDEYVGGWKRNVKNGFGVYRWVSGNTYTGPWVDNRREGKLGELRWFNGDAYVGEWLDNRRTGIGVLRWSPARGGGCYEGGFVDNQLHGWGRFTFRGIRYDGNWEADRREGKGTLTWDADGDWFEGFWVHGGRQGEGTLHLANGEDVKQVWDEPADIKYSQVTPLKFPVGQSRQAPESPTSAN